MGAFVEHGRCLFPRLQCPEQPLQIPASRLLALMQALVCTNLALPEQQELGAGPLWVQLGGASAVPSLLCAGNPPQHPGLVHAALPEHALAAGGAVCARGGSDVVPLRPIQVSALWATWDLEGTGRCSWELSPGSLAWARLASLWGLSQGLTPPALPHQPWAEACGPSKLRDVDIGVPSTWGCGTHLSDQALCRYLAKGTVSSWALREFPLGLPWPCGSSSEGTCPCLSPVPRGFDG